MTIGKFLTPDGCPVEHHTDGSGLARLLRTIRFRESTGRFWSAQAGMVGDGTSVPRFLWALFGHPWESDHQRAGWLHDAAYQAAEPCTIWQAMFSEERERADAMFYEAIWTDIADNGWSCRRDSIPKWRIFSRLIRRLLLHYAQNEEAYAIYLGVRLGAWLAWWRHGKANSLKAALDK